MPFGLINCSSQPLLWRLIENQVPVHKTGFDNASRAPTPSGKVLKPACRLVLSETIKMAWYVRENQVEGRVSLGE